MEPLILLVLMELLMEPLIPLEVLMEEVVVP